uniref:Uncharacterized protein n=1 Tax=Aegilops tauschii subsp. strangulata TaxID=200361 RepID=A0A453P4M1_AEGTS
MDALYYFKFLIECRFIMSPLYGFVYLEGMEQQQIQERGAQSGDQRDDGEVLRGILPLPIVRLAHRRMRRAFTLQDLHLRGVSEKGAGRCQEDGEEDWPSQFSAVAPAWL